MIKILKYILLLLVFIFYANISIAQNTLKLNNSSINVSNGAFLNCAGSIILDDTAKFINNGEIQLQNNWINNSSDSALLGNGTGKVVLYGGAQNIEGANITKFYRLELLGTDQKKLKLNTLVSDSLILNSLDFATDSFKLFITSADTGIITRTTGYISSLDTGCLVRNTNSLENYLFPVGSNLGTPRYRPIEIKPNNTTLNSYSARFANTNATNENFDITIKEAGIGNINPFWYHRINRVTGTSSADISIYKTVGTNDEAIAHWENNIWTDMGTVTSVPEKVTKLAWNNFDTTAFILTTSKPIIIANNDTSICESEDLQLNVNILAGTGPYAYYWSPSTFLNDSNLVNPYATNITSSIEYIIQVFDSAAMEFSYPDTVVVTVNPIFNFTQNTSICDNDSIYLEGAWRNTAGTYYDTLNTVENCDSIITTNLTINPTFETNTSETICSNDSIYLEDAWQNTDGIYRDTLNTVEGCDSVIVTDLTVNPAYEINETEIICGNDSIFLEGNWQNTSGIYYDSLLSILFCDSIIITDLTVNNYYNQNVNTSICNNDSIYLEGAWRNTAGTYYDTLNTVENCDSIIITSLNVYPTFTQQIDTAICSNDSIYLEGAWQNTSGNYSDNYSNIYGCDSAINTILTVLPFPTISISADTSICIGNSRIIMATGGDHYYWSNGETTSSITVDPNISTTYYVTVSLAICSDTTSSVVNIYQRPIALDDTVYLKQNSVKVITDVSINDTYTLSHYAINIYTSNGTSVMQTNGIVEYTPNEYYYGKDDLTYILTDSICPDYYDEGTVYYIISNEEDLIIPNAITPNGDGIHDYFDIGGISNYPNNELIIFNRWGAEVYTAKPYNNNWYGTAKDGITILPNGTYYYVLKLNDSENNTFSGYIELVK